MSTKTYTYEDKVPCLLWVAWMSRWDQPFPTNAYAVGVYDCPGAAEEAGKAEEQYRGLKYGFQHSPCTIDMIDAPFPRLKDAPEPPSTVLVCSVFHPGLGHHDERWHLVGLFSSHERATHAAGTLYPAWNIHIVEFEVTRSEDAVLAKQTFAGLDGGKDP